jgi:hypothetical protein
MFPGGGPALPDHDFRFQPLVREKERPGGIEIDDDLNIP